MTQDRTPDIAAEIASELNAWRTRVLNVLLIVVAVAALPALAFVIIEAIPFPDQWPAAIVFLVVYLFIAGLAVWRRLDPRVRAGGLLLLGYATGVLAFARGGLIGDGRLYLLALPVLALILLGVRASLLMTGLSLLTYVFFTITAYLGWMEDWLIRSAQDPLALDSWISAGAAFGLILIAVVALQWLFARFQMNTLQAERQAATDLTQTHDLLRERAEELENANRLLAERTAALTAAAEVAQQVASLTDEQSMMERFVTLLGERFASVYTGLFLLDDDRSHVVLRHASNEDGRQLAQRSYQVSIESSGPIGQTLRGKQVHLTPTSPAALPAAPEARWQVVLPLLVREEPVGVLDVRFGEEQPPSDERIQALRILTNQLAAGLENARLWEQTQANLAELNRLQQTMSGQVWQQFAATRPDLHSYQSGTDAVSREVWQSLFAQAQQEARPVSAQENEQFALAAPVKLRDVPIGAIGFHRPVEAGDWRPDEIALVERVAERTALALENVRLLKDTQRRAAQDRL
ncbi:MAG: GAF domain-containing protein, partial [Chloroflexi bacterium]|nr:GAF domain-containing protein [Chloroflexota bacterium]